MKAFPALGLAILLAGCASTKVGDRQQLVDEQLPRPAQIWVHDFAASADAVPTDSGLAQHYEVGNASGGAEHAQKGKELGASIATELVSRIQAMGMPARRADVWTRPAVNDLVIRGYLLSFDEGSAAKRVTVGLGAGGSDLHVAAEGFQVTAQGLRKLGSGSVSSGSGKTPGGAVGAATFLATANPAGLIVSTGMKAYGEASGKATVDGRAESTAEEIAKVLEQRFQEQGWIE